MQKVHECWQIDAKENLCLLDGSKACYLTMVDKKSGAVLVTPCFNKGKINQVSELAIRDELIKAFCIWGKPQSVRLDNGRPLGDPQRKSFPTLGLWLTALGIEVIYNRPRRPTDNASVERMQQTTKNWAEIGQAENLEDLRTKLDWASSIQREKYKVSRLSNQTRKEAFPQLWNNTNSYSQDDFDANRAFQHLTNYLFARVVSKNGVISLYGNSYSIGKKMMNSDVSVRFDSENKLWLVFDKTGTLIKELKARNFTENHLWNLTLCQRTSSKKIT